MKKTVLVLCFALAFAFLINNVLAEGIPVYNCQSLNQSGGYYILQNNLGANGSCLVVVAPNITIDLNGKIIYLNGSPGQGLSGILDNGHNFLQIYNGSIANFTYGVNLGDVSHSRLENLSIVPNRYYGVYIGSGGNNYISGINFSNPGFQGTALDLDGTYGNFVKDSFFASGLNGILIENGQDNTIIGGSIVNNIASGIGLYLTKDNAFMDIVLSNNTEPISFDMDSKDFVKDYCGQVVQNLTTDGKPLLYLQGVQQVENVDAGQVILCDSHDSILNNVSVITSGPKKESGVYIFHTKNVTFSNIVVKNAYKGMYFQYGSDNNIVFNSSISLSGDAMRFEDASNNVVNFSRIFSNDRGIRSSNRNSVNNTFVNNRIENNWIGLFLEETHNSTFYNNLINSTSRNIVVSDRFVNYFNTYVQHGKNIAGGRFLGGNFWAQPDGKGFSETCRDNNFDGLCDKPYVFGENNFDEVPLARKNAKTPIPDY